MQDEIEKFAAELELKQDMLDQKKERNLMLSTENQEISGIKATHLNRESEMSFHNPQDTDQITSPKKYSKSKLSQNSRVSPLGVKSAMSTISR
jgi:hypothetical protein